MKLIHTADLHADRERAGSIIIALARIADTVERESADAVVVAGDIWNHAIMNVEGSRFDDVLAAFRRLADVAPIFMVYGTPTHDAHGSLEVFERLSAKHPIRILRPGQPVEHAGAIFFGVPEPSLRWLVPEADTSQKAESDLRTALSSHMMAIGAKRREFTGPAILVHHGMISGSRLSNGEIVEGGSGIKASVDDLKATGCDYIALGDNHEPQQVGASMGLQAYYPGSLPSQNFGEEHEAGFNVIQIVDGQTFVHRITLDDFPARRTIRVNWVEGRPDVTITPDMVRGFMVKLEISCDRGDVPMIDETEMLKRLTQAGAAVGSIIGIKARPTETVRFAEIAEKDSPEDKLALWFEQSGAPITDEQRLKHRQVAAEVSGEGAGPRPGHIELTRLVLRGAVGLKDMSGLDEIDWNLDDYPDGLVALIGSNGSGKTTMVENFHPWPQLLTREGTLKSNFFLKDSMRDLYWTDHRDGAKYRAKILINGVTESADPKYFLYRQETLNDVYGTEHWQPIGDVEGRLKGYEEEINQLFGSLDLFLKSAFVTQSPPNGIAQIDKAKRADRMVLFSALCGLEFWELYRDKAKFHMDAAARKAELAESELKVLEGGLADPEDLIHNIHLSEDQATTIKTELDTLASQGKQKADEAASLKAKASAQIVVRDQLKASEQRLEDLKSRVAMAKNVLFRDHEVLSNVSTAEAALRDLESWEAAKREQDTAWETWRRAYDAEEAQVKILRDQHDETQRKARADYDEAVRVHGLRLRSCQSDEQQAREAVSKTSSVVALIDATIQRYQSDLSKPVEDHCALCKQLLPEDARKHVLDARTVLESQLKEQQSQREAALRNYQDAQTDLEKATKTRADHEAAAPEKPGVLSGLFIPPVSTVPAWDDTARPELARKIARVNISTLRAQVTAAGVARDQRSAHELALKNAETDLTVEESRAEELRAGLDQDVIDQCNAADAEVERLRQAWAAANSQLGAAQERVKAAKEAVQDRDKKDAELAQRRTDLETLHKGAAVWDALRYAYSDKGVQALELDALAPSISSTANALLEIFGSVFRIEFQTTRISGSGKAAKQVEDLLIQVMNQETGKSREISLLSGGERVWVLRALYDAFGLIRAKNSDVRFLTAVQDEADGALDVDARMAYLRMIEDAHRRSGRRKTIIVTHSETLQTMIPTKIFVRDLGPRKEGLAL